MSAIVRIYGPKICGVDSPIQAEFTVEGMNWKHPRMPDAQCRMFGFMTSYSGMDWGPSGLPGIPAPARQGDQCLIAYEWDWADRQGKYFSCPMGGRIEIEAA